MGMEEFNINDKNKLTSGFITPEGYFDNFSIDINNNESQPETDKKVIFINSKRWISTVAAALIVVLSVTIYFKIVTENTGDYSKIENYITNHSEISQYDLINLLDQKDIENLGVELNSNSTKIEEEFVNTNEIENYLID